MIENNIKETVYSRDTIEFVTVCVEYCAFLEGIQEIDLQDTTDKLVKLVPLLYLKASLAPDTEMEDDGYLETSVTEDDYAYILSKLRAVFGKDDAYLEVFLQDMKYSDTPIVASIAEDLTDVYQDVRNFITIYEHGVTETMNDALYVCIDNFKHYWGQRLVNVLRALHMLKYSVDNDGLLYDGESSVLLADNTEEEDTW